MDKIFKIKQKIARKEMKICERRDAVLEVKEEKRRAEWRNKEEENKMKKRYQKSNWNNKLLSETISKVYEKWINGFPLVAFGFFL